MGTGRQGQVLRVTLVQHWVALRDAPAFWQAWCSGPPGPAGAAGGATAPRPEATLPMGHSPASFAVLVTATRPRPSCSLSRVFQAAGFLPSPSRPSSGQVLQDPHYVSGAPPRRGGGTPSPASPPPYPFPTRLLLRLPICPGASLPGAQVSRCGGSKGCRRRPRGLGHQLAGALAGGTGSRAGRGGKGRGGEGRGREGKRGEGRGGA